MKALYHSLTLVGFISLLAPGCQTLQQQRLSQLRADTAAQNLARDVSQLKSAVRDLQVAQGQALTEVDQLRSLLRAGDGVTATRLDAVERSLREQSQARDRMRSEIIDRVSRELERLGRQQPSSSVGGSGGYTAIKHTVETGQTLSAIAAAYGVKADVIVKINKLKNPNAIRVGQVLLIPE